MPEVLASRKVVLGDRCTEESETAKSGTDEQELYMRLIRTDKVAHRINVQTLKREVFYK